MEALAIASATSPGSSPLAVCSANAAVARRRISRYSGRSVATVLLLPANFVRM